MTNKKLLYILLALGAIYLLSQLFNSKKDRSFETEFVKLDTAAISKIVLHSAADNQVETILEKMNGTWTATHENKKVPAEFSVVSSLLNDLRSVNVKSIASQSKEKLKDYEIEDGKGSKVEVYNGSKKVADFVVGKFGFNAQAQSMISYVRKAGDDKVYATDGFQSMTFNQAFTAFRDKTIAKFDAGDVQRLSLISGANIHEITKSLDGYLLDQKPLSDTNAIKNYLNSLQNLQGSDILDDYQPTTSSHSAQITTGMNNIDLKIYDSGDTLKPFIVHSSSNPDVYFKEDSFGVYRSLVKGMGDLVK
ncbi:MAG: DUF4340 domain-containing protein [Saprospiraceae bacterium]